MSLPKKDRIFLVLLRFDHYNCTVKLLLVFFNEFEFNFVFIRNRPKTGQAIQRNRCSQPRTDRITVLRYVREDYRRSELSACTVKNDRCARMSV